jgi:hypothetical protein
MNSVRHLLIALDNSEKVDALIDFSGKLIFRMRAMSSSIADIKSELQKIQDFITKWSPSHSSVVAHYATNPPAAIDDARQQVKALFDQIEAEANKSAALFSPPVETAPVDPTPHV